MTIQGSVTSTGYLAYNQFVNRIQSKDAVKVSENYDLSKQTNDMAASVSLSQKIRQKVLRLSNETSDIQVGITRDQIIDSALSRTQDIMNKMTELSVKATDDTISTEDRFAIHKELRKLVAKLDAISKDTKFDGNELFVSNEDMNQYNMHSEALRNREDLNIAPSALGLDVISLMTSEDAFKSVNQIDKAKEKVEDIKKDVDMDQKILEESVYKYIA